MPNIFEELMNANRELSEGKVSNSKKKKLSECKCGCKKPQKIKSSNIRLESRRIFEEEDLGQLDDEFAVSPEDAEESEDEVVLVIDPEMPADEEVPEDAAEDMIGDSVYKCPVCGANYVCNCDTTTEGIETDEEGVPTECPICGDDAEQILVGEIAPAEGAGEETDLEPQEVEDDADDVEESEDDFDAETPEDEVEEEEEEEPLEDSLKRSRAHNRKKYESRTQKRLPVRRKSVKEDVCPDCNSDPCICDIDMDGDLDYVEAEPTVEDAPAVEINADTVTLHFDDQRFESLMTRMIRENYRGTPLFKVTKVSAKSGKLFIEYVVRESKNKRTHGKLVCEGFSRESRKMSLRCKDKGAFTESFTKAPSFIIECIRVRNQVIPTGLKYNFKRKVNESLYRVYGSVNGVKKSK